MRTVRLNLCRIRAQWPGRGVDSHSGFARRKELFYQKGRKNGVLVPLPPWAKEPAAGAAELFFGRGVPF